MPFPVRLQMKRTKLKNLVYTALSAGLLCVLSPIALPFGVVPITLCTLLIYLYAYIHAPKVAVFSVIIYVACGFTGLPVFSSFTGGITQLLSPSGGFILGYIPFVIILTAGFKKTINSLLKFIIMLISTFVLYAVGAFWYLLWLKSGDINAVILMILPFIPGDIIKMTVVSLIGTKIKSVVNK